LGPDVTATLHLGVNDVPYAGEPRKPRAQAKKGKANRPVKVANGQQTTGDVATWLENKYHIMEAFFESYSGEATDAIAHSVASAIEALLTGAPMEGLNPFAGAESELQEAFKIFLESAEIETLGIPGVPTKAALDGVNHRLKSKQGGRRPSFIDTGQYEAAFRAWVDQE
jgi:hypothetical protein